MSKRLTDSTKFNHPWFRRLPGNFKLAFYALLDLCDCAGVWRVDLEDLEYRLKAGTYAWDEFLREMGGRVLPLEGGERWQIRDYIAFQYGTLNPSGKNRVHVSVIKCLRSHGIDPSPYFSPTLEATVDATVDTTVGPTVKEKEKAKEKEKISISHPDPDPASVFAGVPVFIPSGAVRLGPHEIRAPLIAAGAKFYGKEDAEGWLGVVKRCGGLNRVIHFMERMPAEERADRVKVETFIQRTDRSHQKALRLDKSGEASREAGAERNARELAIRASNEEAKAPIIRICEYLADVATPQDVKDRALLDTIMTGTIKQAGENKFSAVALAHILKRFPELRPIAHPTVERSA